MQRRTSWGATVRLIALGILVSALVAGCSDDDGGSKTANTAPEARITGGPLDGTRASYTARVFWTGWDFDGVISRFEYAVDPPSVFSLEDLNTINTPAMAPDISIRVLQGPLANTDTLVVSRNVEGVQYSFRYVQTLEFSRSFAFETPNADSLFDTSNGRLNPVPSFSGIHSVYVRAFDNDGAYSEISQETVNSVRITYTAQTVTPVGDVTRPNIEASLLTVGPSITICWDGLDADSPDARKKPVGYIFKLLNLDKLSPPVNIIRVTSPDILYQDHENIGAFWQYQNADTACFTYFLATPGSYVFGVRAVDIAGAIEPYLEFGRNATKFQAFPSAGFPTLAVVEPSLGRFSTSGTGQSFTVQVPVGKKLRFTWSATAESYGGTIEGYSWGVDITDLDREGPGSGWSGWGQILGNFQPVIFNSPGVHVLYVRCRDLSGNVTLLTLILEVVDFPLDREVLMVDDSADTTNPRDADSDTFWAGLFENSGRFPGGWDTYSAFGVDDAEVLDGIAPRLDLMARYRLLVWDVQGGARTALLTASVKNRHLGSYMGAGGKLFLTGRMSVGATTLGGNGLDPDLVYPKEILPGMFAWDFLKLYSSRIDNDKGTDNKKNGFITAVPAKQVWPQVPNYYPQVTVDPDKLNRVQKVLGATTHVDAIFDPIFTPGVKGFVGELDSLYAYGAAGNIKGGGNSSYHNRLCAIRWYNPDPSREQGRMQWFGFPFYFIKNAEAQTVFNQTIDWFREESPVVRP